MGYLTPQDIIEWLRSDYEHVSMVGKNKNPFGGGKMAKKRHYVKGYTRRGKGGKRVHVKGHYSK